MLRPAQADWWKGRLDTEDGNKGRRWHQVISTDNETDQAAAAILGFASDKGVALNKGRAGAKEGPRALRSALSNLAWHHNDRKLLDVGDIEVDDDLPAGQRQYAETLTELLQQQLFVLGLGGGHEIGWPGFLGCQRYLEKHAPGKTLGILNFDAHFDLRKPSPQASSGTPFWQAADYCAQNEHAFEYACLGVARSANTAALYERAQQLNVRYIEDLKCSEAAAIDLIGSFLNNIDFLYVTVCLDVYPAAYAPGVSAPAGLGVAPAIVLNVIQQLGKLCQQQQVHWLYADVAELCPSRDIDARSAKLAARTIDQLLHSRFQR
jgi:formiminoglutamase